jgi:KUP system potassium uptake protein
VTGSNHSPTGHRGSTRVTSSRPAPPRLSQAAARAQRHLGVLTLGALGVVFGDLGTSPLYALQACFNGPTAVSPTHANVMGAVSLFVWSLVIVVSVKYIAIIMCADNQGEGGILALLTLALGERPADATAVRSHRRALWLVPALGFVGTALLYGDGIITPAISVLSAIEGLEVATPAFHPFVVPLSALILIALFAVQRYGTGRLGAVFGVIVAVWFVTIGVLGAWSLAAYDPGAIAALDPRWGVHFFIRNGWHGVVVLGAVVLCLTGVEALYADMGHFGTRPIRLAWFLLAFPALVLSYLGQGALLLKHPEAAARPFFDGVPAWALYPMVALATAATVVASQALIAAVFSMTSQAAQLGYLPRVRVVHTSSSEIGQIYLPGLNWILMLACLAVVLGFRSSDALASAYGLAVAGTMTITTMLFAIVARRRWGWSVPLVAAVATTLFVVDASFLGANLIKIASGGWFPLVLAAAVFTLMSTWTRGRALLRAAYDARATSATAFIASLEGDPPTRTRGAAVFMNAVADNIPPALLQNLKHNGVLHETVVLLTLMTERVPYIEEIERIAVASLGSGFWRVTGRYGFMEHPNVPALLSAAESHGLKCMPSATSYYLSRETIVPSPKPGMAAWRERLFGFMQRNATSISAFFGLTPDRVVELGTEIEI